jgi:glycosyltransferase involved in cell wall biosynthesis
MKIAIDTLDLQIAKTGQRTYLEMLIEGLNARIDPADDLTLFVPPTRRKLSGKLDILYNHLFHFYWKQIRLPWLAAQKRCDYLICTDYFVPLVRWKTKYIVVFHDAFFFESPEHYNRLWLLYFKLFAVPAAKKSYRIVTTSHYAKGQLVEKAEIPRSMIEVIYQGGKSIQKAAASALRAEIQAVTETPYILHVGVLEKRKNLVLLIQAFHESLSELPNTRLVFVGQAGPKSSLNDAPAIVKYIDEHSLHDRVLLTGYVDSGELLFLYRHALMYVFPSTNEGFGIPIIESWNYNVPVLCARATALPEIGGEAAAYFEVNDKESLAKEMVSLAKNEEQREKLIEAGAKRRKNFDWHKAANEYLTLMKKGLKT